MPQFSESIDIKRPPEDVWRAISTPAPSVLEEDQEGKTFFRHVRYSLDPSNGGTLVRVTDKVDFKGLGKLAAPIASRDIRKRWDASLRKLKDTVEAREEERR